MKIELWNIGKPNDKYLDEGIKMFTARINHYNSFEIRLFPPLKNAANFSSEKTIELEGELYDKNLVKGDFVCVLDEKGRSITSIGLSEKIQSVQNMGLKRMIFIIGGAYGISTKMKEKADMILCLSKLTFTHQMARLIVTEQIYRAYTILKNEKYHNP